VSPTWTARDFERWVADRDPAAPRALTYHTGHLARDTADTGRQASERARLAALAAAALYASGALPAPRRTGGTATHSGQWVQGPAGPALVALTQRRLGTGKYEYVATRIDGGPRA
jgi:hypothetical protein